MLSLLSMFLSFYCGSKTSSYILDHYQRLYSFIFITIILTVMPLLFSIIAVKNQNIHNMKQMFAILTGSLLMATASFAQTDTTTKHKTVVHKHTEAHHSTTTTSTTQPAATTVTHQHTTKAHSTQSTGGTEVTTDSTSVHRHVKKPS